MPGSGGNLSTVPEGSGGAGSFERCELVTSALINNPPEPLADFRLARFNSDGYMDGVASRMLCCADTPEVKRNIHVFTGGADGTLSLLATLELEDPPATAALVDLNDDAFDDILAITPNRVVPFINDGSGVFARQAPVDMTVLRSDSPAGQYDARFLDARDFNEDGFTDLAFYSSVNTNASIPAQVHVVPGDGLGKFGAPMTTELPSNEVAPPPAEAGSNDLRLDERLLVSKGDGSFGVTQLPGPGEKELVDIDGDGLPDDWAQSDEALRIYLAGDDGVIPGEPTQVVDSPPSRPMFGEDLNGDGVWDVAMLSRRASNLNIYSPYVLTVYFGRGDGTFEGAWTRDLTFYSASFSFSDVGGDGRRELVATGLGGTGHTRYVSYSVDCSER